jgi:hypothetical protein
MSTRVRSLATRTRSEAIITLLKWGTSLRLSSQVLLKASRALAAMS